MLTSKANPVIQYHYQHFLVAKATLEIAGHGHRVSEWVFRSQRTFWPCFTLQLVSKSKQRSSSRKDTFTHNDNLGICCLCLHGMLCVVSAGSWTVLIIRQVVGPASSIRAINYPAGWTTSGTGTRQRVWSVVQTVQNTDSPVTSLYPGPELLSFWSN